MRIESKVVLAAIASLVLFGCSGGGGGDAGFQALPAQLGTSLGNAVTTPCSNRAPVTNDSTMRKNPGTQSSATGKSCPS